MAKNGILAQSQDLQESLDAATGQITISIDLGDRFSQVRMEAWRISSNMQTRGMPRYSQGW